MPATHRNDRVLWDDNHRCRRRRRHLQCDRRILGAQAARQCARHGKARCLGAGTQILHRQDYAQLQINTGSGKIHTLQGFCHGNKTQIFQRDIDFNFKVVDGSGPHKHVPGPVKPDLRWLNEDDLAIRRCGNFRVGNILLKRIDL